MVDIQSPTAEIRRGKKKKKKERNYRMKIYMVSLLHRATIKSIADSDSIDPATRHVMVGVSLEPPCPPCTGWRRFGREKAHPCRKRKVKTTT